MVNISKILHELMIKLKIILPIALLISISHAFYVPGIAPREFSRGSKIGKVLVMMLAKVEIFTTFR